MLRNFCGLLVVGLGASCAVVPPKAPIVRFDAQKGAEPMAATNTADLNVVDGGELPDGIALEKMELYADPSVPTPDEPHRVLGEIRVQVNKRHVRDTYIDAMKAEAAKHGANTLVVLDETGDKCYSRTGYKCRLGVAVWVSAAPSTAHPSAKEVLAAWMKEHAAAGRAEGAPRQIDLAATETFEITPRRGECVTLVLALDDDGRVSRAKGRPAIALETKSEASNLNRLSSSTKLGPKDRALSLDVGCAQGRDAVRVAVKNSTSEESAPGSGKAILQILKRTVDAKTLKEKAKQREEALVRSDQVKDRMQQEACDQCIGEWRRCVIADPDVEKGGCAKFNSCVQRSYADPRRCETR